MMERIVKEGKITFARFMEMALYHPQYGYYNSEKERIGKSGDYYTSPTVHKMFGELIAKQLKEMWRTMGRGQFTVAEIGANSGWLCHDIIHSVRKKYPDFYDHLHYCIIETNPYAGDKQRLLLNSSGPADKKVSWHSYTKDGFSFDKIEGCFLSNEFVDALPVHRLRVKNKVLKEIYVGYNGVNFFETEGEVSTHLIKEYLERLPLSLQEGQECEVNLCAVDWLKHISEKLQKGFVITIDYGDTIDRIYREGSLSGTVRCFYKHTVNRDYYHRPGEQDITAHVDFTTLMDMGKVFGLEVTGFTKQSHYFIALGILERLNTMKNDLDTILKVKNLFHPEGMGEVFKVLIQHKNIEDPHLESLRPLHLITL
ncbi:MAG: class I SAM-dependent methyltransferase [Candidatus Loosdrechtia sp.]|uniref:class I SAM-dependent methyltransferase n=1 Tax=Candidatus Loosdrechtia sp. TaxID=3101272 RepID=UPI003A6B1B63|nr:MAG: SAM-dependent methyltransferase [Candidatus Jettenia sp. AMX2]